MNSVLSPRFSQLVTEVAVERKWGQKGGPWEFNLRDLFRWCQLMQADQSPAFYNPGQHVGLVYADRMRTEADKAQVAASAFVYRYFKIEPCLNSVHFFFFFFAAGAVCLQEGVR